MNLTDAQRTELADRAVAAIREHLRLALLETDRSKVDDARQIAELAVTDAVTRAGIPHTHIAKQAACSTLHVAELITDLDAAGRALGHERQAARRYTDKVRAAIQAHAVKVAADGDRGTVTRAAEHLGATRKAVYDWAGTPEADVTDQQLFHAALAILTRHGVSSARTEQLAQGLRDDVTLDAMARRVKFGVDNVNPGAVTYAEMNDLVAAHTRALHVLDEPRREESARRLKAAIRRHYGWPEEEQ